MRLKRAMQVLRTSTSKFKPASLHKPLHVAKRDISHVPLGPFILTGKIVGSAGSSVPFLGGISDALVLLMERAEDVKRNREECKALAHLAEQVVSAVAEATNGMDEDEMDDSMRWNLAVLEQRMGEISETMSRLTRKSAMLRFWRQAKYDDVLGLHRRELEHHLKLFQVCEELAHRAGQARNHRAVMAALRDRGREPGSGRHPSLSDGFFF